MTDDMTGDEKSDELLPCPYPACSSHRIRLCNIVRDSIESYAECLDCGARGPTSSGSQTLNKAHERARNLWNELIRYPPVTVAELARLVWIAETSTTMSDELDFIQSMKQRLEVDNAD